jgi:TPR repeat protein
MDGIEENELYVIPDMSTKALYNFKAWMYNETIVPADLSGDVIIEMFRFSEKFDLLFYRQCTYIIDDYILGCKDSDEIMKIYYNCAYLFPEKDTLYKHGHRLIQFPRIPTEHFMNGLFYLNTKQYKQAVDVFKMNFVNYKCTDSLLKLANCYNKGYGVLPDRAQYETYLRMGGDHSCSLYYLALISYDKDDFETALELFKKNYEINRCPTSLYYVAVIYNSEECKFYNIKKAMKYHTISWEKYKDLDSLYELIKYNSVTEPMTAGALFMQLIAAKDNFIHLGDCYAHGYGVDKNFDKAYECYLASFINNPEFSETNISKLQFCYNHGLGVEINVEYAKLLGIFE